MNITEMRAVVRVDLHDEDSNNYLWTDDELDRNIRHAVGEYSERLPIETMTTLATVSGSRELDISDITGRVMLEAVEYPVDKFPRRYQPYSLWGDKLTLLGDEFPDGSDVNIYYGKRHSIDAEGSTVPGRHEELIVAGAAGYAAVARAVYSVNRVNAGGTPVPGEFLEWGNRRLRFFQEELRRLGRRNRVRRAALFTPGYPAARKTTDYGPRA